MRAYWSGWRCLWAFKSPLPAGLRGTQTTRCRSRPRRAGFRGAGVAPRLGTALGRVGLPDDIGGAVASLLSDDSGWINGQRVEVAGGIFSLRVFHIHGLSCTALKPQISTCLVLAKARRVNAKKLGNRICIFGLD